MIKTWLPNKRAFQVPTPPGVPPLPTLMLLVGHRGCGKGVALTSLLRHYRKLHLADRIFWISPTICSNAQYLDELGVAQQDRLDSCDNRALQQVIGWCDEEEAAWEEYQKKAKAWRKLHSQRHVEKLSSDLLCYANSAGLLEEGAREPVSRYGHKPVLHLVIDDCMGTPLMSAGPRSMLTNLAIKARHIANGLGLSMYICVQTWSAQGSVPRAVRENATGVVVFSTAHKKQVEKMAEELTDRRGPEVFLTAYEQATQPEHGFLYVCLASGACKTKRYNQGWNTPLS